MRSSFYGQYRVLLFKTFSIHNSVHRYPPYVFLTFKKFAQVKIRAGEFSMINRQIMNCIFPKRNVRRYLTQRSIELTIGHKIIIETGEISFKLYNSKERHI